MTWSKNAQKYIKIRKPRLRDATVKLPHRNGKENVTTEAKIKALNIQEDRYHDELIRNNLVSYTCILTNNNQHHSIEEVYFHFPVMIRM